MGQRGRSARLIVFFSAVSLTKTLRSAKAEIGRADMDGWMVRPFTSCYGPNEPESAWTASPGLKDLSAQTEISMASARYCVWLRFGGELGGFGGPL